MKPVGHSSSPACESASTSTPPSSIATTAWRSTPPARPSWQPSASPLRQLDRNQLLMLRIQLLMLLLWLPVMLLRLVMVLLQLLMPLLQLLILLLQLHLQVLRLLQLVLLPLLLFPLLTQLFPLPLLPPLPVILQPILLLHWPPLPCWVLLFARMGNRGRMW